MRVESSFNIFRTFIIEMEVREVTFRDKRWTWANRQRERFIEKRLDMFFGSAEWLSDFDKSKVQHILTQSSSFYDFAKYRTQQQKLKSRFIFDSRWSGVQSCVDVIQAS